MEKTGIELISEERNEQLNKHKWSNDNEYTKNELAMAALFCITLDYSHYPETWNDWFYNQIQNKQSRMGYTEFEIERYKIAGALLAAEIDRLQNGEMIKELEL